MLRWKDSVRFEGVSSAIVLAIVRAVDIYETYGADCWITSLNDSTHMIGSRHYVGTAVDLRTRTLSDRDVATVASLLRDALGPAFDVVLESDHLHIEYDPPDPLSDPSRKV